MERESFEDESVAKILNDHFVSIKVDREERPDVDSIYMSVCQMMTGRGGWPTSVFMTAEQKPFFAGTYFPKESAYGMPGFKDILNNLHHVWTKDRKQVIEAGESVMSILQKEGAEAEAGRQQSDAAKMVEEAYRLYAVNFDLEYGGSRGAPKFPSPHTIWFLLRYGQMNQNEKALEMAEKTLESMYKGGMYDHVGFGFCRYSTDEKWLVPHFEKMLYDNALLLIAYAEMWQCTKKEIYKAICKEIIEYVQKEMLSPEGGFYTAIDADSEGEEGKFYLWTKDEVIKVLGQEGGEAFCSAYGITTEVNFEGKNIPNLIGREYAKMPELRKKLEQEREKRVKPHKDDKILTGQNGMMIAALAFCSRALGETEYLKTAQRGVQFIRENMFAEGGRLLSRYRNGESGILGYADDYAYMIWGLLECYEASMDETYLQQAEELNKELIRLFWDEEKGGVFLYGKDGEKLIKRPKEYYDGAVPSANSVCAHNFIRLSHLMDDPGLSEKAEMVMQSLRINAPLAILHLLSASMHLANPVDIKVAGGRGSDGFSRLADEINSRFLPFSTIKYDLSEKEYKVVDNKATVYACKDFSCGAPTSDLSEALK